MFYFNFSNMKYSVCRLYACFLFTSNCLCVCVYSFHRAELLIFKHMISMATRSRTSIIRKLLSVFKERERERERGGDATKHFPCGKNHLRALHFHVNLIHKTTHWKLKNVSEKHKNNKILYGRIRIYESSWKTRIFINQSCIWENLLHSRICQNC